MNAANKLASATRALPLALAAAFFALRPVDTSAAEMTKVTTAVWRIHKPSKDYKDLPVLLPKEQNGFEAGLGLIEFVCLKSAYYMLLVQPSVKLRDAEPATVTVRAANTANEPAPTPLTFRNLYKTKTALSRSLNWDADIHYTDISAAMLTTIGAANDLELTLAERSYAIALSDLGGRLGSFQRFCEKGIVTDPTYFEEP